MLNNHNLWYRLASEDPAVREDAQNEYREWATNPVTQQILNQIRGMRDHIVGMSLPPDPATGNALSSAQRLWMLNGMQQIISRLESMDVEAERMAKATTTTDQELVRLHADFYGTPTEIN